MDKSKNVFIIMLFSLVALMLWYEAKSTNAQRIYTYTQKEDEENIKNACMAIIHCIWIDHPSYVEDVLWETDEMINLDSLLKGDWKNTFEFWSEEDSIRYHINIFGDEIIDKPSIKAKPDKPSEPVLPIEIPKM